MRKSLLLPSIILVLSAVYLNRIGCTLADFRPKSSRLSAEIIDPTAIPIQENIPEASQDLIRKMIKDRPAILTPRAHFKIAGRVVSKRHYYKTWEARLSPVDLALAWGPMASTKYDKFVSYRDGDRYYSYTYSHNFPLNTSVIAKHTANQHLIPANRHIEKTLKSIEVDEIIELEGLLVDVEGKGNEPQKVIFKTSLSREDTGAGACEVIYVTRVRIGKEVFE
jgi:hypothetical protein